MTASTLEDSGQPPIQADGLGGASSATSAAWDAAVPGPMLGPDGAVDPSRVHLFRGPFGVLRCTLDGEKTVLRAKVVKAFPLSFADEWINVLDGKNKEVCLIRLPSDLDEASRLLVVEELNKHYRVATITHIHSIRNEYRTLYWDVVTDLGPRDFVTKWSADSIVRLGPTQLLLVDIDTNRFRIDDIQQLNVHSRRQLDLIS